MKHGISFFRGCIVATVFAVCSSCTFNLEDVEAVPSPGSDGGLAPDAAEASPETDGTASDTTQEDAGQEDAPADVAQEVAPIDGCWPPSDAEFCAVSGVQCGPLQATDACGQARDVACGDCAADAHCDQGSCVNYTYAWATGPWSSCSVTCGGGTRTRVVRCSRDDGETVSDAQCSGTKPVGSEACNGAPCCVTPATMLSGQKCSGGTNDIIAWVPFHFGLDDGSPANQALCAAQCTVWAEGASFDAWCCDLVEDKTTGHSYSCSAHTGLSMVSFSHPDSEGSYAALGGCATP